MVGIDNNVLTHGGSAFEQSAVVLAGEAGVSSKSDGDFSDFWRLLGKVYSEWR